MQSPASLPWMHAQAFTHRVRGVTNLELLLYSSLLCQGSVVAHGRGPALVHRVAWALQAATRAAGKPGAGQAAAPSLIPLSRANNVSIMLTQFSSLRDPVQEIKQGIVSGNLGVDRLSLLLQVGQPSLLQLAPGPRAPPHKCHQLSRGSHSDKRQAAWCYQVAEPQWRRWRAGSMHRCPDQAPCCCPTTCCPVKSLNKEASIHTKTWWHPVTILSQPQHAPPADSAQGGRAEEPASLQRPPGSPVTPGALPGHAGQDPPRG